MRYVPFAGRRVRHALVRELAAGRGHLVLHVDPRRVVVGDRIGERHPVADLARTRARGRQARMVERHAGVEDSDDDAAAVVGRVARRRIAASRRRESACRRSAAAWTHRAARPARHRRLAPAPAVDQRHRLVEADGLHPRQRGDRLDLVRSHDHAQVVQGILAIADRRAERADGRRDGIRGAGLRGDEQRDGRLARPLRLRKQAVIVLRQMGRCGEHTSTTGDSRNGSGERHREARLTCGETPAEGRLRRNSDRMPGAMPVAGCRTLRRRRVRAQASFVANR